jgi:PAS domain S-box-containing protein
MAPNQRFSGPDQFLRVIAETTSDAIITINQDSTIVFANRATEKIFGYSQDELIGQRLTMLMPDYLRSLHREAVTRYLTGGTRHITWNSVEMPGLHKNGRNLSLEISFGEFSENGVHYFTGIVRDATDNKRLETRLTVQYQAARILAESDSLEAAAPKVLRAICQNLGWNLGQMWVVDRDADLLRWIASYSDTAEPSEFETASRGRHFARGVGFPGHIWAEGTSQWITDYAKGIFPRSELAARSDLQSAVGFAIKLGEEVSAVMEFFAQETQAPDESLRAVMTAIGNQIGQFIERKRAQHELAELFAREQRARLELETAMNRMRQVQAVTEVALSHLSLDNLLAELLDRVRDAMDVDTVTILLLEEGDTLVAWATKGLDLDLHIHVPVGSGFAGRIAEQKAPLVIDDIETAELYTPFLREHGVKTLLGVPLLLEGRVLGVIHVGRRSPRPFTPDDTRLLQLVAFRVALAIDNARLFEEERAARQEAEAANRAKDEFLTTLSHELRTPLTPVIGWVHMVRTGMLPPKEIDHGLAVIEKNAHALKRLINDLLDMTAILSGKMRMEELPVHLTRVVNEAIETARPFADSREVHLEVTFRDWHDEIVTGDSTRLGQVFGNLLHNAIKFSLAGGHVHITCATAGDEVVVTFQDKGCGITPEFLPRVFEKFVQADGSKTRAHGGLGLGLALVKSFTEAHHGTIEAQSGGIGHGSRFTVRLPRRKALAQAAATTTGGAPAETKPSQAHILIVEDDEDTLELLQSTFRTKGFRVTTCQSAQEALEIAPANSVDLILSDIGMPHMDGFEMMKELRQLPTMTEVPAIALSGYVSQKDTRMALDAGFNAHISKPVEPAELLRTIARLLEKSKKPNGNSPVKKSEKAITEN